MALRKQSISYWSQTTKSSKWSVNQLTISGPCCSSLCSQKPAPAHWHPKSRSENNVLVAVARLQGDLTGPSCGVPSSLYISNSKYLPSWDIQPISISWCWGLWVELPQHLVFNPKLSQGWKSLWIPGLTLMCRHLRRVTLGVRVTTGPGSPRLLLFQVCLFLIFKFCFMCV